MTENALVSFASGRYVNNLKRLESIVEKDPSCDFLAWIDTPPPGSSPHSLIPYDFKPHAIWNAYRKGYRTIIWFDSVIVPNRPLTELFDMVKQNGYLILLNGWTSGEWCADRALEPLGITRDESFDIPHAMACVLGFDLSRPDILKVFEQWKQSAPAAFPGPWNNQNNVASSHPRVLGHRHDQTAISVFAHKAGWRFTPTDENNLIKYGNDTLFYLNSYHAN